MKLVSFSRFFNPLYVLIASVLGGAIIFLLFVPFFPLSCKNGGTSFFCVREFFVVFFLMTILWCMMTVLFIPGWAMFIWLFKKNVAEKDKRHRSYTKVELLIVAVILAVSSVLVTGALNQFYPDAQSRWDINIPIGVDRIIDINSVSLFLVFLPYILGMFLVYSVVRETSLKLQETKEIEANQSVELIKDLLIYRKALQIFLFVSGALLSMVPLIMVAIRSVLMSIDPEFEEIFPVTYIVFGGLTFSLLLLFIYFPAYLELSVAGRQVRDLLFPLDSIDNLKDAVEKRKVLDDLLQTKINFTENLQSGILTLAPFISSLLVFLGIKL